MSIIFLFCILFILNFYTVFALPLFIRFVYDQITWICLYICFIFACFCFFCMHYKELFVCLWFKFCTYLTCSWLCSGAWFYDGFLIKRRKRNSYTRRQNKINSLFVLSGTSRPVVCFKAGTIDGTSSTPCSMARILFRYLK